MERALGGPSLLAITMRLLAANPALAEQNS
jgi:hypothetical protein